MQASEFDSHPKQPTTRLVLLGLAAALALLPFLVLCWYAHPSADDFLTANDVRKHGHWGYIGYMYMQWTGRYTAATLWGLVNPVAYGNTTEGYGLVCLLGLLGLPTALYLLVRALLGRQFPSHYSWLAAGGLTSLFLFQMPSPAEGFYWITSSYNYLVPACLTLLWLAALVRHAQAPTPAARRTWLAGAALLAVLVIGGNETNALPVLVGTISFTLLRCIQRRTLDWEYLLLSAVVVGACAVAFLAPGNFVRLHGHQQQYSLLKAADRGALSAYRSLINWMGNGVLLSVTVLLAPVSSRLSRHPDLPLNQLARRPLFSTLLLPVTTILVFSLAHYATSTSMPPRSQNVLYLFFLLGWFLTTHAWALRFWQPRQFFSFSLPAAVRWLLAAWIVLAFFWADQFRARGRDKVDNVNNILQAYQDWLGGAAARYDAQLMARYAHLQSWESPRQDVVVEPLQAPSKTLLFYDITPDASDWSNQAYAEFFGKSSVRVPAAPPAP
ncbi:DUF6056 family protein [Hymenobacter metallicola]|uniref:Glycosyltransferase RgtA/B/C/D-like domain-containing protein n=1 Tax=Hymenobacter metallicola TaxID=2563114 RepID=A0A4Z0Q932_9BACT|nr:DUF6056 family protein [Hymenobacter metallicola]TGE26597.1 hypothetical protein E5K02_17580 [Hymenobacter metallicola]